jgi:hypothetical protein
MLGLYLLAASGYRRLFPRIRKRVCCVIRSGIARAWVYHAAMTKCQYFKGDKPSQRSFSARFVVLIAVSSTLFSSPCVLAAESLQTAANARVPVLHEPPSRLRPALIFSPTLTIRWIGTPGEKKR